jgi:hypothetical protein
LPTETDFLSTENNFSFDNWNKLFLSTENYFFPTTLLLKKKVEYAYLTGWAVWLPSEAEDSLQPADTVAVAAVPTELADTLKTKKWIN